MYKFTCPHPHNHPETYIGHTRTTLSRRLSMHTQGGSLHAHFIKVHGCKPNKKLLGDNTEIISYDTDPNRLKIKEALMISQYQPTINIQDDKFNRTLLLHCGGDGGCASVSRFTCGPATNFASQVQESVCTLGMDECDYVLRGDRPVGPFITTRSARLDVHCDNDVGPDLVLCPPSSGISIHDNVHDSERAQPMVHDTLKNDRSIADFASCAGASDDGLKTCFLPLVLKAGGGSDIVSGGDRPVDPSITSVLSLPSCDRSSQDNEHAQSLVQDVPRDDFMRRVPARGVDLLGVNLCDSVNATPSHPSADAGFGTIDPLSDHHDRDKIEGSRGDAFVPAHTRDDCVVAAPAPGVYESPSHISGTVEVRSSHQPDHIDDASSDVLDPLPACISDTTTVPAHHPSALPSHLLALLIDNNNVTIRRGKRT